MSTEDIAAVVRRAEIAIGFNLNHETGTCEVLAPDLAALCTAAERVGELERELSASRAVTADSDAHSVKVQAELDQMRLERNGALKRGFELEKALRQASDAFRSEADTLRTSLAAAQRELDDSERRRQALQTELRQEVAERKRLETALARAHE